MLMCVYPFYTTKKSTLSILTISSLVNVIGNGETPGVIFSDREKLKKNRTTSYDQSSSQELRGVAPDMELVCIFCPFVRI